MPKRIKKTATEQPEASIDKTEALARAESAPVEFVPQPHEDSPHVAEVAACIICGTLRTADVCPVDGYRFAMENA